MRPHIPKSRPTVFLFVELGWKLLNQEALNFCEMTNFIVFVSASGRKLRLVTSLQMEVTMFTNFEGESFKVNLLTFFSVHHKPIILVSFSLLFQLRFLIVNFFLHSINIFYYEICLRNEWGLNHGAAPVRSVFEPLVLQPSLWCGKDCCSK